MFFNGCEYMKLQMTGITLLGVMALLLLVFSAPATGASVAPLEQLKGTVEAILAVMQDEEFRAPDRKEVRRARIMALVDARFDFAEMSKMTLARNWHDRTKEEREEFQKLFSDLLKNNYIGRVESYSDERIEYAKEIFSQNRDDKARVYTNIIRNGHEIPINYSVIKEGDEWFVYDVAIEGVSLVRNYRTEFGRILNKEKFPGLIKKMQEKIESNETKRESE
jgi:phospholipid transport system substrate-binding protein